MAVPKKRKTSTRSKQGRAHQGINAPELVKCVKCGGSTLPHQLCPTCGYYGEKKILDIETKLDKKLKREKKAAAKDKSHEENKEA